MKFNFLIPIFFGAVLSASQGASIGLYSWTTNVDGVISDSLAPDAPPAEADFSGFSTLTGLGTVTLELTGIGAHYLGFLVDHDIDTAANTFFNEYGSISGSVGAGQSWEIDEPEIVFGDIFTNFTSSSAAGSALDNSNAIPSGSDDDVSMAMGWNFTLAAGQTGTATFLLSEVAPASGFYLTQTDPDSLASIYFSSALNISGGGEPNVPEGGLTLAMLGLGLTCLGLFRQKTNRR